MTLSVAARDLHDTVAQPLPGQYVPGALRPVPSVQRLCASSHLDGANGTLGAHRDSPDACHELSDERRRAAAGVAVATVEQDPPRLEQELGQVTITQGLPPAPAPVQASQGDVPAVHDRHQLGVHVLQVDSHPPPGRRTHAGCN